MVWHVFFFPGPNIENKFESTGGLLFGGEGRCKRTLVLYYPDAPRSNVGTYIIHTWSISDYVKVVLVRYGMFIDMNILLGF